MVPESICSKNQLQTHTLAANIFTEILGMLRGGRPWTTLYRRHRNFRILFHSVSWGCGVVNLISVYSLLLWTCSIIGVPMLWNNFVMIITGVSFIGYQECFSGTLVIKGEDVIIWELFWCIFKFCVPIFVTWHWLYDVWSRIVLYVVKIVFKTTFF